MTVADARSIMFTIHRERRRLQPWATRQTIEERLERIIANDKAVVAYELALIERATELDSAVDLDGLARDILRRSDDAR